MYVPHRGLNVIVSGNVLQRKRVGVLPWSEMCGAVRAGPRPENESNRSIEECNEIAAGDF